MTAEMKYYKTWQLVLALIAYLGVPMIIAFVVGQMIPTFQTEYVKVIAGDSNGCHVETSDGIKTVQGNYCPYKSGDSLLVQFKKGESFAKRVLVD